MTAHVEAYIECDRPTGTRRYCGRRLPELPPYDYTVPQLRELAKAAGWLSTGTRDYCPDCAYGHHPDAIPEVPC